jgi:hypothetical protein
LRLIFARVGPGLFRLHEFSFHGVGKVKNEHFSGIVSMRGLVTAMAASGSKTVDPTNEHVVRNGGTMNMNAKPRSK